jgi:uncharacterized protein
MKHRVFYLFLLWSCSVMIIQAQQVVKDGFTKIYYPNAKVSSEGTMRNGQPDGYWKTYFPTGVLKSEGNRKNHLLDSLWVFYNESGDTLQKVNYLMGKKNGFTTEYEYRNNVDPIRRGYVRSRELYVNDKRAGKSYYYYDNGNLHEVTEFGNNRKNGTSMEYDPDGILITVERYIDGNLVERLRMNRSDKEGLKQGLWRTYYENGRVKTEATYKDGILNGSYKEYDENGTVKVYYQYNNGNLVVENDTGDIGIEVRTRLNDAGNVIYSGTYRKDVPVGIHRSYDDNGKVTEGVIYDNNGFKTGSGIITNEGKKEGPWKYFYSNGALKASGSYTNNQENGTWKYYFVTGKPEQEGVFKNGKYDGLWQWYFANGNLKREEEYYGGKEEGNCTEYDTVGNVISKGSYFDGMKEGAWIYKVGDYEEKGSYKGDLREGKWQAFYADGTLKYEGSYLQGNPDGEHKFYYPSGKLKEINYFVMGIAEKNWKRYDEAGNLLLTVTYKDNREYRINGEKVEFAEEDIKLIQ